MDITSPDGSTLITANELHMPEDVEVNLTMKSADVIHSFGIPVINGKRDAVPGNITNLSLIADDPTPPGEPIPGQCAEFCGLAHADMRIKLHVHTATDFASWTESQLAPSALPADDSPLAAGCSTFNAVCTTCHQVTLEDVEVGQDVVDLVTVVTPDEAGRVRRVELPGGETVQYAYDGLARPVRKPPRSPFKDSTAPPIRRSISALSYCGMA